MSIIGLKALGLAPPVAVAVQPEPTRHYKSESTEHYTPDFVPFWSPFEGDWERFIPVGTPNKVIEGWRRDMQDLAKWSAIMRGEAVPVSKRRRGIVMLAGGPTYTLNAYINCRLLRHMGCRLPIEWFYLGDAEISAEWKGKIQATLKDVYLVNLGGDDRNNTKKRGGWQAKIEAIIRSTCDDVLFLDADSFPHCNPKQLFDHPFFKEHDCVLWPDVRKLKQHKRNWMLEKYGIDLGRQEVESGQMMFHKPKCREALLKTREINQNHREVYKVLHGDKDTFLAGAIHANINWAIVPYRVHRDSCRNLVQLDFDDEDAFTHLTGKSNKWKQDSQAAIDRTIYPHWEEAVNIYNELRQEGLLSPHVTGGKSCIKAPDRFCADEAKRIIEKDMYEIRPMIGHRVPVEYIIDIGANAGGFTIAASNAYPHAKILAVEADPELEQDFRANTANCKAEIHYVKKACVGKTPPNTVRFVRVEDFPGNSHVDGMFDNQDYINRPTTEIRVPAITLLSLLKKYNFPRIDILKIDAEGVEGEIFSTLKEAGLMPNVHWIRGEWHGQDDRPIIEAALQDTHVLKLCSGTTNGYLIAHNKNDAE